MRRIIVAALLFAMAAVAAADSVNRSSSTATNDSNQRLFTGSGYLDKLIVGRAGKESQVQLWDGFSGASTWTYRQKLGVYTTTATWVIPFELQISSGLVYTATGAGAADLLFLYKR